MSVTDELLANNEQYAANFDKGGLPSSRRRRSPCVACMDARLHLDRVLGLQEGDAHVIRNAGGVVTDDEIRSLAISQNLLGTEEIILIHHTDCGMLSFTDDEFMRRLEDRYGKRPHWDPAPSRTSTSNVRESIGRIRESPFIPNKSSIRGFVYDVETGSCARSADRRARLGGGGRLPGALPADLRLRQGPVRALEQLGRARRLARVDGPPGAGAQLEALEGQARVSVADAVEDAIGQAAHAALGDAVGEDRELVPPRRATMSFPRAASRSASAAAQHRSPPVCRTACWPP